MPLRRVGMSGELRLTLTPPDTGRTVVDGAWWPYSTWLVDQAPQLLAVFDTPAAPARRIIVHAGDWTGHPDTITVDSHQVRVHRLATLFPHMMFIEADTGYRIDLLVVPPGTEPAVAGTAMRMATDPTNTVPASHILDAATDRVAHQEPRPPAG